MAIIARISVLILIVLFLILSILFQFSSSAKTQHVKPTSISASSYSSSNRNLLALQRKRNQIPSCNEMMSRSQCSQNSKCRWCRSEALDDMCFSKTEAWRLPQQVFTCDS